MATWQCNRGCVIDIVTGTCFSLNYLLIGENLNDMSFLGGSRVEAEVFAVNNILELIDNFWIGNWILVYIYLGNNEEKRKEKKRKGKCSFIYLHL